MGSDNDQGEIYLTDVIAGLRARGERVAACKVEDASLVLGVNSQEELALAEELMAERSQEQEDSADRVKGRRTHAHSGTVRVDVRGDQRTRRTTRMGDWEPRRCTRITSERSLMVFAGRGTPDLSAKVAEKLGIELGQVDIRTFADGEIYVKYMESIRGADVFIVQSTCRPVNENLVELLIMIQAARLASAHRVTAVVPWMGYSRQDKKSCPREPITARLVADILEAAGADRVITMDLHAGQLQGFFSVPVDHMTALSMIADYFKLKGLEDMVVVSPDAGGLKTAKRLADRLECDVAVLTKLRPEHNVSRVMHVIGDVAGKTRHHRGRHHRHRRHAGQRGPGAHRARGPRRSTPPARIRCCPIRPTSASRIRRSRRWWSPTPSRCARTSTTRRLWYYPRPASWPTPSRACSPTSR